MNFTQSRIEKSPLFHILAELSCLQRHTADSTYDLESFGSLFGQCQHPPDSLEVFCSSVSLSHPEKQTDSSNGVSWVHCNSLQSLLPRSLGGDGAAWVVSVVLSVYVLPLTRIVLFCFVLMRHKRISFLDINCNSIIPCLWMQTIKKKMLCSQY